MRQTALLSGATALVLSKVLLQTTPSPCQATPSLLRGTSFQGKRRIVRIGFLQAARVYVSPQLMHKGFTGALSNFCFFAGSFVSVPCGGTIKG